MQSTTVVYQVHQNKKTNEQKQKKLHEKFTEDAGIVNGSELELWNQFPEPRY